MHHHLKTCNGFMKALTYGESVKINIGTTVMYSKRCKLNRKHFRYFPDAATEIAPSLHYYVQLLLRPGQPKRIAICTEWRDLLFTFMRVPSPIT